MKQHRNKALIPFLGDLMEDGWQDLSNGFNYLLNLGKPKCEKGIFSTSKDKKTKRDAESMFRINRSVLDEIYQEIGTRHAEYGGVLGGDRQNGTVEHFYFDTSAHRSGATYSPNADLLNQLFAEKWNPKNINLLGFVHSHPSGFRQPSTGDLRYAERILKAIPELNRLLLPIVISEADTGTFELLPFAIIRQKGGVEVIRLQLEVIEDQQQTASKKAQGNRQETFRRVVQAYDLRRLAKCRVICVGVGGAVSFIEELARAGVGEFVLIDKDTVSETNLATQQVYRKDIGRAKVECLAERIKDINPEAKVFSLQQLLDELDDTEFSNLITVDLGNGKPVKTILLGLTDNFYAQARVNRLALQFGLPSLCAQVYKEGRGAEISFTYPGVTSACHRCLLSSRYDFYLKNHFDNDITSDGTPIFATTRLNALKGFIILALLHHGTKHLRWGNLLEKIRNRNLIQIRMDPDLAETIGLGVFDRVFNQADKERLFFDETIWLPQKPDRPENGFPICPDCRGTGDLGESIGSFSDTRIMRN